MNLTPEQALNFDKEMKEELKAVFPADFIPFDLPKYASMALLHESVASLRLDYETYEKIAGYTQSLGGEISYFEISFLINCLLQKTPTQLGVGIPQYLEVQKDVEDLSKRWNELVDPIKKKAQRKVTAIIGGVNGMRILK